MEVIAVGDRVPARAGGLCWSGVELQLNSIGDEVCRPGVPRAAARLPRGEPGRGCATSTGTRFRDNPLRVLDCKDEACREVRRTRRGSSTTCATRARSTSPPSGPAWTEAGIEYTRRPDAGPGPRLLHADGVRVRQPVARRRRRQRSWAAAGTTGWPRRSGGPPTPGVGFGIGARARAARAGSEGARCPRRRGGRHPACGCFVVPARARRPRLTRARSRGRCAETWAERRSTRRSPSRPLKRAVPDGGPRRRGLRGDRGRREREAGTVTLKRMVDGVEVAT